MDSPPAANLSRTQYFYVVCDIDRRVVGWVVTAQEADAICDKHPEWQWDVRRRPPKGGLPLLTIHD